MDKILSTLVLVPFMMVMSVFTMMFISFINAVIVYFIWNHLAPIYFTAILQPQFIHLPFIHCWLFLYLLCVLLGTRTAEVKAQK